MLRHGPDGHISSAAPAESQLDPTGPPSCLAPAKVSIPSSCALPSLPLMTYLTIINPESNRDEPGERLMAPSAGYTCSAARLPATKLWPNRRPRSPGVKDKHGSLPSGLGCSARRRRRDLQHRDLQHRDRAHYAARGGERGGRPSSLPFCPN